MTVACLKIIMNIIMVLYLVKRITVFFSLSDTFFLLNLNVDTRDAVLSKVSFVRETSLCSGF